MEANSCFRGMSPGEAAQHHYTQGLQVLPLNPDTLTPDASTADWLSRLSPSTIARHWQNCPKDAVGYVLRPNQLTVTAHTKEGSQTLHDLAEVHGVSPRLTHFGRDGETWHLTLKTNGLINRYRFSPSQHLRILAADDIALLHPVQHAAPSDNQPATDAFLDALTEATKKLSVGGVADDPAEAPSLALLAQEQPRLPSSAGHPFEKFSITGNSAALHQLAQEQVLALGQYALLGQATALYAAPNTGKTLIVLSDLGRSIQAGTLNAGKVFYFNLDDNSAGLLSKLHFAEKHGFHMVADGHAGFSSQMFLPQVRSLIDTDHPKGTVLVLDTVKKVADLMDKKAIVEFTAAIRRFVMKGGTVVALAHTNKHAAPNGRPVYAGTADMVDDFDCAYTLQALAKQQGATSCFVELKNLKRRGGVKDQAVYSYQPNNDYAELLASVREVPAHEEAQVQQQAQLANDSDVIAAIKAEISGGNIKRGELLEAARHRIGVTRAEVERVLDRNTGSDPSKHLWQFSVKARGAKVYSLHDDLY